MESLCTKSPRQMRGAFSLTPWLQPVITNALKPLLFGLLGREGCRRAAETSVPAGERLAIPTGERLAILLIGHTKTATVSGG